MFLAAQSRLQSLPYPPSTVRAFSEATDDTLLIGRAALAGMWRIF
ncbi:hypothetical protein [Panacagrimonas sp.]